MYVGYALEVHPEYAAATHAELARMYGQGMIRPAVAQTYRLEDLVQAFDDMASRKVIGKIVVEP